MGTASMHCIYFFVVVHGELIADVIAAGIGFVVTALAAVKLTALTVVAIKSGVVVTLLRLVVVVAIFKFVGVFIVGGSLEVIFVNLFVALHLAF